MPHPRRPSTCGPRQHEMLRAAWGTILVVAPAKVAASLGGPVDGRTVFVARLLGARHLVQGVVTAVAPSRRSLLLGGFVDLSHSASMVLLGRFDPGRRRLAWTDGVIAASWGAASLRDGRQELNSIPDVLVKVG